MVVKKSNKAVVDLPVLLCKSRFSYAKSYFFGQNLHWKRKRFVAVAITALYVVKGSLYILR